MEAAILVVDDEPLARGNVSAILREHGFEVEEANDGKEALPILKAHKVDLVITDIRMPRLNGVALMEIIKKKFPHTAVLIMTGDPGSIAKLHSDNLLMKPIKLEELLTKALRILRRRKEN